MNTFKLALIIALSILMAACASSGEKYYRGDRSTYRTGTVESVRHVRLEGSSSPLSSFTGSIIGSLIGISVGNSRTSGLNSFVGSILGSLIGASAERALTSEAGIEVTVILDDGGIVSIVQDDDESFAPGDRVNVIDGNRVSVVTH